MSENSGMKNLNKRGWNQETSWKSMFFSAGVAVLVLLIAGGLAYVFRVPIFNTFAAQSIREGQRNLKNGISDGGYVLSEQSRVVSVVDRVLPSVVSVVISKEVPVYKRQYEERSPFGGFGGSFLVPQLEQNGTKEQKIGGGSGFVVTKDGLVVTNKHVVSDEGASYTIITNDGKTHKASVVARDPLLDIAFLQIEGGGTYEPLLLGDSSKLRLGQSVIAIGNALGEFHNSVSVGVISGLSRSIIAAGGGTREHLQRVIQTDAAINPGNSGGPLLDLSGDVIGVNVAVAEGTENIGFSIPSNIIKDSVESVEKTGEIIHPYLGVRYIPVTEELVKKNNLRVDHGALVISGGSGELAVIPGSPADKAGIVENDIILSVDGNSVTTDSPLDLIIRGKQAGEEVTIIVMHDGKQKTVKTTLQKAPEGLGR